MDYLRFEPKPSGKHKDKHHIIIVGAGIIGVCTAYFLTTHPKFDPEKHHITVIESKRVAGGASGKAGGLLALWAFPQQIVPMSFDLHQSLSNKYNGEAEWGYRRLTTVSLEGDLSGVQGDIDSSSEDEDENDGKHIDERIQIGGTGKWKAVNYNEDTNNNINDKHTTNNSNNNNTNHSSTNNNNSNDTINNHHNNLEGIIQEGSEESYKQITEHTQDSDSSAEKPPKKTARNTRAKSSASAVSSAPIQSTTGSTSSASNTNLQSRNSSLSTSTISSSSSSSSTKSKQKPKSKLPPDINWIDPTLIDSCSSLGGADTTAQVLPYKFTNFMLKKAVEYSKGSIELIIGKVEEITYSMETGKATGVLFKSTSVKSESNHPNSNHNNEELLELTGDQIVLSVGPWTSKILPDCPISGLRAHSITVAPFKDQSISPYAVFTELKTGPSTYISPEIYARHDEVYVCGEGDSAVDVPETTDDVEVVKSKCDELFRQVGKISPNLRRGHILKRQACYLPVLDVPSSSGPLIGETNVENLFLASGHSCWGINNAPGTGKIMSELLFDGACTSADISSLDPSLYFDASVLVGEEYEDDSETGDSENEWS